MIAKLPGIPPLPNYGAITSVMLNVQSIIGLFTPEPVWGVFDEDGNLVLQVDSIIDLKSNASSRISEFPVELGQFASYNKVQRPDEIMLRMSKSQGGESARGSFITVLDAAKKQTMMFTVITPERNYTKVCVEDYRIRRESESGANEIIAEVSFKEIREIELAYTSSTEINESEVKNPGSADAKPQGKVQAKPASASETATVNKKATAPTVTGGGGKFGGTGASGGW